MSLLNFNHFCPKYAVFFIQIQKSTSKVEIIFCARIENEIKKRQIAHCHNSVAYKKRKSALRFFVFKQNTLND